MNFAGSGKVLASCYNRTVIFLMIKIQSIYF